MPNYVHAGRNRLLKQTKFHAFFDSAAARRYDDRWISQFGDSFGFGVRKPVWMGERLSFALQPMASFPLRSAGAQSELASRYILDFAVVQEVASPAGRDV